MVKRLIASLVCISFLFCNLQLVHAQDFSINQLPVPGTMVGVSMPFAPLSLKGLIINPQKPLEFQFIVDTGRVVQNSATVKEKSNQLVKYFLAGLTIPEGDLWVNLSPYEKDRITTDALGKTDLGRDLLAQDYILKQLTASLIYPEKNLGKEFWSRVYQKAQGQFGTTNIPVNTFNKVWILPDEAQVFEKGNVAYITKSTLKVMLDEDYLAKQKNQLTQASSVSSQVVRQIILPEIEKEVNRGKNFAPLRQIYQAMILAKWYKETIQNGILDAVYTNKKMVSGVNLKNPAVKEEIYQRYLVAYKKGAFNYIKEDATPDGQTVVRKYFSGGISRIEPDHIDTDGAMSAVRSEGPLEVLRVNLEKPIDAAMKADDKQRFYRRVEGLKQQVAKIKAQIEKDFSDGKVMGAIEDFKKYEELFGEYQQEVARFNSQVTDDERMDPEALRPTEQETRSLDTMKRVNVALLGIENSLLSRGRVSVDQVKNEYRDVMNMAAQDNLFYKIKRDEKIPEQPDNGFQSILKEASGILESYFRLRDNEATLEDAKAVFNFSLRELSRDQDSLIGNKLVIDMWSIASKALIDMFLKNIIHLNDPDSERFKYQLEEAKKFLETDLSHPISQWGPGANTWKDFKASQVIPLRTFLDSIDPKDNIAKVGFERKALFYIIQERYVDAVLKMIQDPGFQNEIFLNSDGRKFFWFSGSPGAGKDLFINFLKQKIRSVAYLIGGNRLEIEKPILFTERGVRVGEKLGRNYHYVLREYFQSQLSQRMFKAADIKFDYDKLMEALESHGLVEKNTEIPEPDGKVIQGELIKTLLILAKKPEEIRSLLPGDMTDRDKEVVTSILLSSAEMASRLMNDDVLLPADINKQRQAMAIKSFVQQFHFYIDPDGKDGKVIFVGDNNQIVITKGELVGELKKAGINNEFTINTIWESLKSNGWIQVIDDDVPTIAKFNSLDLNNENEIGRLSHDLGKYFPSIMTIYKNAKEQRGVGKADVVGLDSLLSLPKLVIAEVGREFAIKLQDKYRDSQSAFISPISREQIEERFRDDIPYEKAYQAALQFHKEDIDAKRGATILDDQVILDKVRNANEAQIERLSPIERREAIVKYETVKNIHSRNIKEGSSLTAMNDLQNRAFTAAIQVIEELYKKDIENAESSVKEKYYKLGKLAIYSVPIINIRQPLVNDFMEQTFNLGHKFARAVFDPIVDMDGAMMSDPSKNADMHELLQWLGFIEKDREEIGADTPMNVILKFFNNDPQLFMQQMQEWREEFKAKLGIDVTVAQMLTADPKKNSNFEFFQLLDENGNLLNKIKPRALVHYDGDWHRDVRILILDPSGKKVFIQKRGEGKDIEPGLLADSVGGHTRIGESYYQNAIREAGEELGLAINPGQLKRLGGDNAIQRDDISNGLEGIKHRVNRSHYAAYVYQLTQEEFDKLKKSDIDYDDGITPGGVVTKRFFDLAKLDTEAVFQTLEENGIIAEDIEGNNKFKRTGYAKQWNLNPKESIDKLLVKVDNLFPPVEAETIKSILKLGTGWLPLADLKKISSEHPEWLVDNLRQGFKEGKIYQQYFDSAQTARSKTSNRIFKLQNAHVTPGGIDLNQINVHRTGKVINIKFDKAQLNDLLQDGFEGFTPVIVNMTPIQDPLFILGVGSAKPKEISV